MEVPFALRHIFHFPLLAHIQISLCFCVLRDTGLGHVILIVGMGISNAERLYNLLSSHRQRLNV